MPLTEKVIGVAPLAAGSMRKAGIVKGTPGSFPKMGGVKVVEPEKPSAPVAVTTIGIPGSVGAVLTFATVPVRSMNWPGLGVEAILDKTCKSGRIRLKGNVWMPDELTADPGADASTSRLQFAPAAQNSPSRQGTSYTTAMFQAAPTLRPPF